jgi:polyhydroxyalkanoate synthesis regulator phasin
MKAENSMDFLMRKAKEGFGHYPSMYRSYNYQEVCSLLEEFAEQYINELYGQIANLEKEIADLERRND